MGQAGPEEPVRYPHQALASILEETYGVIVYQEQVLFVVQAFAGYSLGQADILRKAMGKKIPEVMKKERRNFIKGARENGFPEKLAEEVCQIINTEIEELPRKDIIKAAITQNSAVLVASSLQEALDFTNEYATEHLLFTCYSYK